MITIELDITTLLACGVLLLLAVVTPFASAFARRPRLLLREGTPDRPPRFSIVMGVSDNARQLEQNLPAYLDQHYEPGFEVIVVDESSTDDTADVLKRLKADHPNLYTTFIPDSSHYLSRRKLALTIGVKAAKNEWVIMVDADCRPTSSECLATLARYCDDPDVSLVLGHTRYDPELVPAFHRFYRLLAQCYLLRHPYRYEGCQLVFRRDMFLQGNGFLHNLRYLRGEYDFLVNEYGNRHNTVVATEPDAHLVQAPTPGHWRNHWLYYMETRRHLTRRFLPRLLFDTDQLLLHLNLLLQLAALGWAAATRDWLLGAVAAVCLLLSYVLRLTVARRAARSLGEELPAWRLPLMELRTVWTNLALLLRHRCSDKYDYLRR